MECNGLAGIVSETLSAINKITDTGYDWLVHRDIQFFQQHFNDIQIILI